MRKINKKGTEWWMAVLAAIILIIIGLVIYLLFFTEFWGGLTSSLGTVSDQAINDFVK